MFSILSGGGAAECSDFSAPAIESCAADSKAGAYLLGPVGLGPGSQYAPDLAIGSGLGAHVRRASRIRALAPGRWGAWFEAMSDKGVALEASAKRQDCRTPDTL